MSQETNLNVAPYFDDFNASNDYYKVLFKPAYPVQARELNNLQSILQNQIEKFGQHFFKEGAKVVPGNTSYNNNYNAVELEDNYLGIPLSDYIGQLVGAKITGGTSGITAIVDKIILGNSSERGKTTLYLKYVGSSTQNNSSDVFFDNEVLTTNIDVLSASTVIGAGEPFASTLVNNATSIASAFSISNGIYFAKGQFVNVKDHTILLDQYSNTPSYRIGLYLKEEIINADIDPALNDNANGFTNYSAPGADRLKITTSLIKKELDDFDDNNFIELAVIDNGILRSKKETTDYNILQDELARRTYAESGDYYVRPFGVQVKESLNNYKGNHGVFTSDQLTYSGSVPSKDLGLYQISPGRAFVKGYDIETISSTYVDLPKPRTTKSLEDQAIPYNTGATLKLNKFYGAPQIGIGNTYILSLRDRRVGTASTIPAGKEIGVARVYDCKLESGSYDRANGDVNEWDLTLYDIETVSEITLNEPITLTVPTHIKGQYSGATAFLKSSVAAGAALTVYEVKGDFVKNENFVFNGIDDTRIAIAVTNFGISDVRSVFGNTNGVGMNTVGAAQTFSADTLQTPITNIGIATISGHVIDDTLLGYPSASISTVRSTNPQFPGQLKVGNILQFSSNQTSEYDEPILANVVSVGSTHVVITGVNTVTGVADGKLPASVIEVSDLKVVGADLQKSFDNSFYTALPKSNISNVDLTDASLTIRKTQSVLITGNQLSENVSAGTNETFLPFTPERYSLVRSDGTIEVLTSDRVQLTSGSTRLQIYGLTTGDDDATLITTLKKLKPKSKDKIRNRVNSIIVDKSTLSSSGIGTTTGNDGLTYGNYPYGTRVQDENIAINVPDIISLYKVYESVDTSDPSAPTIVFSSLDGPTGRTSDLVIGEQLKGKTSKACAIVGERISDTKISFLPHNDVNFKEGEIVQFEESKVEGVINTIDASSSDISFNYDFTNGQNQTFYNYPTVNRKTDSKAPIKKLKIYFSNGYYQSTDNGDITTVDSYGTFDFATEIQTVNGIRNTDLIDIRPRVSQYTVAEDVRSPLEFYGREFNASGNSAANILASDETIVTDYSWYLGRIDGIYVTKDGTFQIKYGTPAEEPQEPAGIEDALKIATAYLPPYLYNTNNVSLDFLSYKRYRMSDIKRLDNRLTSLEYYTALSLLEATTASLFLPDAQGLNRFKSGFFVDNFSSFLTQSTLVEFNNSIDIKQKELRPRHYTTSVDLTLGPVEGADETEDLAFRTPQGTNIKKTGDIITLNYDEVKWLEQSAGTRTESVTPFVVSYWHGVIDLTPASDNWIDTVRLEANITTAEGNWTENLQAVVEQFGVDPNTGFAPVIWNSWQTNWTGTREVERTNVITAERFQTDILNNGEAGTESIQGQWQGTVERTTRFWTAQNFRDTMRDSTQTRTGTQLFVTEQWDTISQGDRVVSRDIVSFMRSRNIQFVGQRIKPISQSYAFFDGIDVTPYCIPKLLEISMISGTFQIGETVSGTNRPIGVLPIQEESADVSISFRVAQSNHMEGPYNAPTKTYNSNPYSVSGNIPSIYSSTSTILNIDTFSLANHPQGDFWGYVEKDMILVGESSGAQATITDVRLIADIGANLIGSFYVPDPNFSLNPRFETGDKVFTLINSSINDPNQASSLAEEQFSSSGIIETVQEDIVSVRNGVVRSRNRSENRTISTLEGTQVVEGSQTSGSEVVSLLLGTGTWVDPLAQSFMVDEAKGIFVTSCDVFFATKDNEELPVTLQLRTMKGGYPTTKILPFSEVSLSPSQVNVTNNGITATTFTFKGPVYLEGNTDYCIVLLSESSKYQTYISRVGETDLITGTYVSEQPYLGSLFKSQNASTWEPSQWEDLKFTLYRADFATTGSVELYNPTLSKGNHQIANLMPNPLNISARKLRVGIGSTLNDTDLTFGNTVQQKNSNATGIYVGNAGIATGDLNIINAGIGYTPLSSYWTYNDVDLTPITGSGSNVKADIHISNGVAVAATISEHTADSGGSGISPGDVLGIGSTGMGNNALGLNARFSVVSIANTNQLILDNVQGDFITGAGNTVQFINGVTGVATDLNGANNVGGNVHISDISAITSGLDILVNHKNHGMYFDKNYVTVSDVESDLIPTKLQVDLDSTTTGEISVAAVTNLDTFENVGVGSTNYGYLKIGEEILSYESASGSTIGITSRSIDSTTAKNYLAGTPVYKYELGGVSLRRINKTHNLEDVTLADPITFDSYNIKLDMGSSGLGRSTGTSFPILYAGETKTAGGGKVLATQNIPFELINPEIQTLTVPGTTIDAQVKTVSGASLNGTEDPYEDQGFEPVTLGENNYMSTPRIVASNINATNKLSTLPGNKSLNFRLNLSTTDSKVSPVIDTQRMSAIFTSNRVNSPIGIGSYTTDNRVKSMFDDPNAFQYISKEVQLENSATSLKILLEAYINADCDIRAFYSISNSENFTPIFVPFPGYDNINDKGNIIDVSDNNGKSDSFVPSSVSQSVLSSSLDFRERTFTMNEIPSFKFYRIKIVATSTSQVYVPRLRALRVLALA